MKKKFILFFLLSPLLCIVAFIAYIYISAFFNREKIYYFPQIETYLQVYTPPFKDYGYLIFSKDSVFSLSENIDFVKIYKSETSGVSFIFNPLENNKIYIVDSWSNAQIKQANFIIEKINSKDTIFFERHIIEGIRGTYAYRVKPQYFEIFVEGYLQSVFYTDYDIGEYLIKAEPIK